ncbi:MAG TPA: hypothetical protein VMF62_21235, partial [Acetobacteraceae bacterium]|nr:hypothetical protein [Acetobacteraceae bacterium]
DGDEKAWRAQFNFWKSAGVTHVTLNSTYGRTHHRRIAGKSLADHLAALRRYRNAIGDLL